MRHVGRRGPPSRPEGEIAMHLPGHYREAFESFLPGWRSDDEVEVPGDQWFRLNQCSDIMPAGMCGDLELPPGSTYAQGARRYHQLVRAHLIPKRARS